MDAESNNVFVSVFVLVGETLLSQAVPCEVRLSTSTHTISATALALKAPVDPINSTTLFRVLFYAVTLIVDGK